MKAKSCMMLMATMVAMLLMAMACSEKNNAEPEEPTKPENPVNPDDWHTVPISGGDISLDNFTISLPSGTFTSETKMAVTKVQAGEICGKNEVTNFYQITSPVTTHKPMTIKIASENIGDGVSLVMHSPGCIVSASETSYSNVYMETTYANGAYTATIPTLTNGEDDETASFSVGLVKVPQIGNASTRAAEVLCENEVRGIKYKLYIDPALDSSDDVWNNFSPEIHASIGKYIEESINILFDMGFSLKNLYGQRVVPVYYMRYYKKDEQTNKTEIDREMDGGFKQDWLDDVYSYIGLNVDIIAQELSGESFNPTRLKCTILHELFHYVQNDMDPRGAYTKAGGPRNKWLDNKMILFEMASVWVEQFMNNGNLNPAFLKEKFNDGPKLGIGHEEERLPKSPQIKDSQSEQGYLLGSWLYYLVKQIKALNLNHEEKHPVLKLFELFSKNWKNQTHNTYFILKEWLDSYDKDLYNGAYWDDYYLQLWQGQLVKDFHVSKLNLPQYADQKTYMLRNNFKTIAYDDDCYSYGCCINRFMMRDYKDIDLSGKELVVKQNTSGLGIHLIWTSNESGFSKYDIYKHDQELFAIYAGDSIVIRGKDLEALRPRDDYFNHEFYVITTNTLPTSLVSACTDKPKTSHITVELRDTVEVKDSVVTRSIKVTPSELEVGPEGGKYTLTVDKGNFFRAGCFFEGDRSEWPDWISYDYYNENNNTFEVTIYPNYTNESRSYDGLTVWAADTYYDWLDKARDPYQLAKVPIRQKTNVKKGEVNYVEVNAHVSYSENNTVIVRQSYNSSNEGIVVTTEPVGQGIRITATEKTSSSYGYGDYESITTFTIPEINDNSGYSEIKDFNLQYTFTPNAEKYPDLESQHYEVEAATIPLDTTYLGLLRWHDVYVIGKSSFMLKNYQKGLNHYSGNPKEGDYITIRISFE